MSQMKKPFDDLRDEHVGRIMSSLGRSLAALLSDGTIFALLIYQTPDQDGTQTGCNYVSNGSRADMIKALRISADNLEAGNEYRRDDPAGENPL